MLDERIDFEWTELIYIILGDCFHLVLDDFFQFVFFSSDSRK